MLINKYKRQISKILPKYIETISVNNYETVIFIKKKYIYEVVFFLKNNTLSQFKILIDMFGFDTLLQNRFRLTYNILSTKYNIRALIHCKIRGKNTVTKTVSTLYNSADWMEREVWDMYGIFFAGHKDLRRILTDYGFRGHPLRKDFPTSGFVEVSYSKKNKKVVYGPIELVQEYRNYNFKSPWNKIKKND